MSNVPVSLPNNALHERVIMITGVGDGVGRALALAVAAAGATVVLMGRRVHKLETLYDEIVQAGFPQPAIFPLELGKTTDTEFDALALAVKQQLGRLDGIVHNAQQFYSLTELRHQTLEQWQSLFRINTIAPFALTRACLPLLKASPDASVIFTSETHALQPKAYWGGFCLSKAAMMGVSRIFADEWDNCPNMRFNTIIPQPVLSPFRSKTHPAEAREMLVPIADILPTYLYLLSGASQGISGQIFDARQGEALLV